MSNGMVVEENPAGSPIKVVVDRCLTRDELLSCMKTLLNLSFKKVQYANTSTADRLAWSRIAIQATSVCSPLLRDFELAELKSEVAELRRIVEKGV